MSRKIVCRVRWNDPDKALEFNWSEGAAAFRPYSLRGELVGDFRENSRLARERLRDLVLLHAPPPAERSPDEISMACVELARVGRDLYNQIFDPSVDHAAEIGQWLHDLDQDVEVESLELVNEGEPWMVPWNTVYDADPDDVQFGSDGEEGVAAFEPFWGIRYNLCGGLPVDPLRRKALPPDAKVLFVIDPVVLADLETKTGEAGVSQGRRLQEFISSHGWSCAGSRAELAKELKSKRPHLIYWLGHAEPEALHLGDERIDLSDLRRMLRGLPRAQGCPSGLVFLNACRTAQSSDLGSFLKAFYEAQYSGIIATEEQTLDNFANPFGMEALDQFLNHHQPIGQVLHALRRGNLPLGLLYGTYCPPDLMIKPAGGTGVRQVGLRIATDSNRGVALGGRPAVATLALPALPDVPYLPLQSFGPEHRALFAGRDEDVERFAMILGEEATRLLVLHGESGVGKSSFIRAGVIPYLEEECVGFRFLRDRREGPEDPSTSSVMFIRATNDLAGQLAIALCRFCRAPFHLATPAGDDVEVDLPVVLASLAGVAAPVEPLILRSALLDDPGLLCQILDKLTRALPYTISLVIDQAEEIFTLEQGREEDTLTGWALEALGRLADDAGDFKAIVSMRTEYFGRLISSLRRGSTEARGVREYLLTDFLEAQLVEAILRPTYDEPLPLTSEIPRHRYHFQYAEGVAQAIARQALRANRKDSVLPLVQVICGQLYDRLPQPAGGTITHTDLEAIGGVEGGIRRHLETVLARLFAPVPSPPKGSVSPLAGSSLSRPMPRMAWDAKALNFAFARSSVGQLLAREVGALRVDLPDRKAFKALFAQLYLRQPDGSLSTALMPVEEMRPRWSGRTPFDRMLRDAVSHRILQVNTLQIGGQDERLYVSLGHDALAKIAASWDEELRRGARLRRMAMGTAAALSLAAIMAILSLVAFSERKIAIAARAEALGNLSVAQNAADQMLTEVGEIDLADIPQMEEVRRRLLEDSSGSFRDLAKPSALGGGETPEIKLSRARAETSLADLLRLQGDDKTAIEHYNTARVLLDPLYNQDPSQPGVRRSLARVCDGLGNLLKTNPRYGDAYNDSERYFRRALELRSLAASEEEKRSLADTWYNLGTLHARKGERKKAHEEYQAAIEQLEFVSTREKDDARRFEDEQRLVRYWINIGINLTARPDLGDAAKVLDRAVREGESLYTRSPGRPGSRLLLSRAKNNLAATFLRRKPADARALLEPAEGLLESLTRDFPKVVAYHQELSSVVRNLAICEPPEKRITRLEKLLENLEALGHKYPAIPEFRRLHARNETALALYLLTDRHDPKGALAGLDRARQTLTSLVEQYPDDPAYRRELGKTYSVLAAVSSSAKDYSKAIAELDEAIKCHQEVAQTDPDNESLKQELCNDFIDLAKVLDFRGDVERALAILNDAVDAGLITQSGQLEPRSFPHLKDREEFRKLRDRLPAVASPKAPAR